MLTSIKGTYENGRITLAEKPISNQKVNVIVTFLEEETSTPPLNPIVPESPKGKTHISDDFNEPLEDLEDYM